MKNLITILILVFGITFTSFAQDKPATPGEPSAKIIKFYPNPASVNINFEFQRGYDKSYSLLIYNFSGKKVAELKSPAQRINITLADFSRGIYFYRLIDRVGKLVELGRFQVVK